MRFLSLLLLLGLSGCEYARLATPAQPDDEARYASVYPYYAEFCALSEINKLPGNGVEVESHGQGGHSTLYLNGACREEGAHYPLLKLCEPGTPMDEAGAGLSVNAHFANVQWVATPGRAFFFRGGLPTGEALSKTAYAQTQAKARALGIYDGVIFHAAAMADKPADMKPEDYMYEVSVGTDYASDFARNRYCARVPVSEEQMRTIVDYLNGLNRPYRAGEKIFNWDVFENNCTHMVHNALAAAGVWEAWEADKFLLFAIFDFPVPANEFVDLMRRTNDLDLTDPEKIYRDESARRELMQYDALPTAPGALAERATVIQPNDVYETESQLIFYESPIIGAYEAKLRDIFGQPRYFSVRDNFSYFSALYAQVATARKPLPSYPEATDSDPAKRQDFANFYARFYDYIERMRARTGAMLDSSP